MDCNQKEPSSSYNLLAASPSLPGLAGQKLRRDFVPGGMKKLQQHLLLLLVFFRKQRVTFCNFCVPPYELNGEGKAGRFRTFFAIAARKKLKNIKGLQLGCHGIVRF